MASNPRADNTEPAQLRLTGGGARSVLDLATYDPGSNAPAVRIQALDDGAYSGHVDILTKTPGANENPLVSQLHIWSAGNVGIGTNNPTAKLEVQGGPMKAAGGFILELRTKDPTNAVTGQMWLRTDL